MEGKHVQDIEAGGFSAWLANVTDVLEEDAGSDVPCSGCTACCTSSQFVHIAPDETETISRIPVELLVPAPGLPEGHRVLGFDEHGRCPMLIDNACSIYDDRPRTCRAFDCRVFAAAGLSTGDPRKSQIDGRIERWRFSYPETVDEVEQRAVHAAVRFLEANRDVLTGIAPHLDASTTAVLSLAVHGLFFDRGGPACGPELVEPDPAVVLQAVEAFVERRRTREAKA